MIRTFDICINAAHPEVKLYEAATFISSPSTAFVRGVPPAMGSWRITAVRLAAAWPDGSIENTTATQTGDGVWAATLQGMDASGRVENGLQVLADGVDETGAAVTGYVLGIADLAVYTRDATIDVDGHSWYVKIFDSAPTPPHKGDAYISSGYLLIFDGTQWITIGGGGGGGIVDDAVTRTSSNAVKSSGIWSAIWGTLTSLPTGFTALYDWVVAQLTGKLNTSGGRVTGDVLMNRGSAVVFGEASGPAVYTRNGTTLEADTRGTTGAVALLSDIPTVPAASTSSPEKDGAASAGTPGTYACGNHRHPTDTSRQAKLSQTQLNNIAAVPNKLDSSVTDAYSITAASGHLAVKDSQSGAVYTFAGPVTSPDDVARGEDLPYATGILMDESEGVHYPIDRAVNLYEAEDGDTTLTLGMPQPMPVDQGGRARDFIVDVDNSANTGALGMEFSGLGTTFTLVAPDGDDLAEMTSVDGGKQARFYFTETALVSNNLPVISVQRITLGAVATAITRGS